MKKKFKKKGGGVTDTAVIMQNITNTVINNLENCTGKWSKPWKSIADGSAPYNAITGKPYQGINWLILSSAPYKSPVWLSYKQAQDLGGYVKKGEKATGITLFKIIEKETVKSDGTKEKNAFPFMKGFPVYNAEQCENLDKLKVREIVKTDVCNGNANVLSQLLNIELHHGGDRACYIPSIDTIKMPHLQAFKTESHYESTLLHEIIHWTGSKDRLARLKSARFGSHSYAYEELVAELGSAMAGSVLGLPYEGLQHDEYIDSWLSVLKGDTKFIVDAAKDAKKALDYILENVDLTQLEIAA
tara:strand:- start:462 stop:1364 length:903 start_codon:yes stop_codon:yes gene_type:complete